MSISLSKKRRMRDDASTTLMASDSASASSFGENDNEAPSTSKRSCLSVQSSQLTNSVVPSSQLSLIAPQSSTRCGKVLRIHLNNFMCHSNLSIDFHSRVNFLVGSNGSGKSALLAALVLGLGGKAKATNRSSSLKQFIKNGEHAAKIEINISNEGPEAYEADKYGKQITVVRRITQTSGQYVIKDARGHVVSKKVDDLHRILMYHNVQVDNPVFVLNQDNAREFLKELEPSKNYKLFLKATQIELVMEKLNDCLHMHKDHLFRMQCFKKKLSNNKDEINTLKSKLAEVMSVKNLKDTLKLKELEQLWILVTAQENELQELLEMVAQVQEQANELNQSVENKLQMEVQMKEQIRNFQTQIDAKNSDYCAENVKYQQMKSKINEIGDRCAEIATYCDSHKTRRSFLEQQLVDLQTHIEEHSKNKSDDTATLRQRNECQLVELERMREENAALIESTKRDITIFRENCMQKEEQLRDVKTRMSSFNENIRRLNSQITTIAGSSKDKLSIFGQHVTQFLDEIDKAFKSRKFSELPRGPIGRYIEVPNGKYRNVVENQLGRLLHAFIVSNTNDRLVLEAILKNRFPSYHPAIITTKFIKKVYDVRRGSVQPPRGTSLLMTEIKCSDPVVMNCLIDRVSIETVLIAENKEIAEHLSAHRENTPQNLQKVIVSEPGLEYYPDPNYRMYSMKIHPARLIQVNVQDRIDQMELEKEDLRKRITDMQGELTNAEQQHRSETERMKEKRALFERHDAKRRELVDKITELQQFEYPTFNQVDLLKTELAEAERRLEDVNNKLQRKQIDLSDAKLEKQNLEAKLREQQNAMQAIQCETNETKNQADEIKTKLRRLNDHFERNRTKLAELNKRKEELEVLKEQKLQALNAATTEANTKGERTFSERTEAEISDDIQRLKAKLKHRTTIQDNPEELQKKIKCQEHTLQTEQSVYENLKISVDMLKKSLLKRFDFIKKLRQHMILILQYTFSTILKLRNFNGSIEYNHHDKTLNMSVIPRDNHKEGAVSNTRSLSGGERSYSTVAFLLSLWACVDHPFYFLDEYDVFTDVVNRDFMTRLLINEGKGHPNRQYSFLTPQDMELATRDFIKIHKLAEPSRN